MKTKAKCLELRTPDGKVILVLNLYEKEIVLEDSPEVSGDQKKEARKEKVQSREQQEEEPRMTDAQKRYLFRILAEHGIEGEEAHKKLKEFFQVDSLKEISKLEASKMIERLLGEAKGGEDDRTPF
jgi:hypothetical protein